MSQIILKNQTITIKRCHGLGNVICLLPVLDHLYQQGHTVNIITRREWVHAFSVLKPEFLWTYPHSNSVKTNNNNDTNTNSTTEAMLSVQYRIPPTDFPVPIDLDNQTENLLPTEHRTDEFARLLGLQHITATPVIEPLPIWSRPFAHLRNSLVFAPEGGHPARTWPVEKANLLHSYLKKQSPNTKLTLIGTQVTPEIEADYDIRGRLELHQLFGLLSVASAVITMDSGVLHIAAALNKPTIALFGGIEPQFRIRPNQKVIALRADMNCCPCNKQEQCVQSETPYSCIRSITTQDVIYALNQLPAIKGLTIMTCPRYT